MNTSSKIIIESVNVFQNDVLDTNNLDRFIEIALEDGVIDDYEKETLRKVFNRINVHDVSESTWLHMQELKKKYSF